MPRRPLPSWIIGALLVAVLGWTADGYASSRAQTADVRHAAWAPPIHPAAPATVEPRPSTPGGTRHAPPAAPAGGRPAPAGSTPSAPAPVAAGTVARTTGTSSVALTFDDGPGPSTPAVLALLRQYHVKATFCLIGIHVRAHPELVRAIVADGHTLCNHSWIHDEQLGHKPPDVIRADLQRTDDAIHAAAPGARIAYYRQPGGNWTPVVTAVARSLGMRSLGWNVDPADWNTVAYQPGPAMTDHVVSTVESRVRAGSIVLSHDAGGDRSSTLAAYRTLLPYLIDQRHFTLAAMPTTIDRAAADHSAPPTTGTPGRTDPDRPGGSEPSSAPPAPPAPPGAPEPPGPPGQRDLARAAHGPDTGTRPR